MKIAYCLPQIYHPGGIERVIIHKANYLADKLNYDIYIITVENNNQPCYFQLSKKITHIDLNLNYHNTLKLPILKRIFIRKQLHKKHQEKLTKILYNNNFDIVISTFQQEASFLYKIQDGSKKILECHFCKGYKAIIAKYYNYSFITKLAYYYKSWHDEHFIPKHYDKMVVLTEEDYNNWKTKLSNVICISNPLSFKTNQVSSLTNKKVIAVGRFDAQKGFDRLLPIWQKVINKCPDWHLHIYGQGEDKNKLENLIQKLNISNSVTLHKPDNNIKDRFLESSIHVMTSRFEGFGLVLTEAMECGVPCVSYTFPCGAKDIISDGIDGFCIDNGNNDDFVTKLTTLMQKDELRKQFGRTAKINVQRYSDEVIMNKWKTLFKELIM